MPVKIPYILRQLLRDRRDIVDLQNNQFTLFFRTTPGFQNQVPTPVFTPSPGSYLSSVTVTITDGMPIASIFYTTDGSTPTDLSIPYTGPIDISTTTHFKAIAFSPGYADSNIANANYTIVNAATIYWGYDVNPTLSPAAIIGLQNNSNELSPYRTYTFGAGSTVFDYFFFWWPDDFPAPSVGNGFVQGIFAVPMATPTEGFTDGPVNGWYYTSITVGGIPGKLWRTFYQLGGGGITDIVVQ